MKAWYLVGVDIVIMLATAIYSLTCMSYIMLTWTMRKDFHIAVRSPCLIALSGFSGTIMSCVAVFRNLIGFWRKTGAWDLFGMLMLLTLYTGAYIFRGFRLLVMYNPNMRKRWGRLVREQFMTKTLMTSFMLLLVAVSAACVALGVTRLAAYVFVVFLLDIVLTFGACCVLFGKLRRTNDVFHMSLEIQKVGGFALAALVLTPVYIAMPGPYTLVLWMFIRFHCTLWITNIKPAWAALQRLHERKDDKLSYCTSLFPWLPWRRTRLYLKIAVDRQYTSYRSQCASSAYVDDVLDSIMSFPPLLEAFEKYCRKALCAEMLMFIKDVNDFSGSLRSPISVDDPTLRDDKDQQFADLLAIVDKYVCDGSPYEVNIPSKIKFDVLRMTDRTTFDNQTLEEKDHVLSVAAKEVGNVLKDNLYNKFRSTEEYKEIEDQRLAAEQLEDN